jgi:hypothetical protein
MTSLRSSARPALAASERDIGLDLDRIVWDPEYRREIIDRLASTESESGTADKPD